MGTALPTAGKEARPFHPSLHATMSRGSLAGKEERHKKEREAGAACSRAHIVGVAVEHLDGQFGLCIPAGTRPQFPPWSLWPWL